MSKCDLIGFKAQRGYNVNLLRGGPFFDGFGKQLQSLKGERNAKTGCYQTRINPERNGPEAVHCVFATRIIQYQNHSEGA